MSDHDKDRTQLETLAREAVHALPDVAPDPAFRARMKSGFAAGTLEPRLRVIEPAPRRRGWLVWSAVAAAAAVALIVWVAAPRPSVWTISDVTGNGIVSVDGRAVSLSDMARSAGLVKAGARLTAPEGGEFQIRHAGMTIFITPGTDMRVPVGTREGSSTAYSGTVAMGQVRITTAPEFQGNSLEFETPETRVRITGTTLAIIRDPGTTCVCVLEGKVQIRTRDGSMVPVSGGHRGTFLPGNDDAEFGEIRDMERDKLTMFRDQAGR